MTDNKEITSGRNHNIVLDMSKFQGTLFWYADVPVKDMDLSLVHDGKTLMQTKTDANGQFKFDGVFPKDSVVEFHEVKENDDRMLYVRVVQRHGEPAQGVKLKLVELGKEQYVTTDDKGVVKVDNLTDKFYNVVIKGRWLEIPTIAEDEFDDSVEPELILLSDDALLDTVPLDDQYEGEYDFNPDKED